MIIRNGVTILGPLDDADRSLVRDRLYTVGELMRQAVLEPQVAPTRAARSLAGIEGLPSDLKPPPDPEAIRDAKGWLKKHMTGHKYSETVHQPLFARHFDLQAARNAPSFAHCCDEIARLITALTQPPQPTAGPAPPAPPP
jgi:hypothetical protein